MSKHNAKPQWVWPNVNDLTPSGRSQIRMTTRGLANITAAILLQSAAERLVKEAHARTHSHLELDAVIQREFEERKIYARSTLVRARSILTLLFHDPETGRLINFGATSSTTGNQYALAAVQKNLRQRAKALRDCAMRAEYTLDGRDRSRIESIRRKAKLDTAVHKRNPQTASTTKKGALQ